jgi:PAS domain S-box-containing protein
MAHLFSSSSPSGNRPTTTRLGAMSIRQKLTILMLAIGLVPTLVVSATGYLTTSNDLHTKTTDQLVSTAVKQEQKITGLLQQRQEDVTTLTNRFDLQSALGQYLATGENSDRDVMSTILQDRKAQTTEIQSVTITDLDGKVIASTLDSNVGKTLPLGDLYKSGEESTVSVREDSRDNIDKLYITTNISVNKKDVGVIVAVFRIDDIVAAVQDYTGLGSTGETVVAYKDDEGHAISLFPLRFDTDAALSKDLDSMHLFDVLTTTPRTTTDYRGHEVIVAPRTIGFANWVLATKIDTDEALASILQLRNSLISLLIFSSAAVFVIALWLTRSFTQPILYLAEVAQRIGKGDFETRVNLKRGDEIGVLGDSINTMGVSLKDFVSHVEAQRNRLEIILNTTAESILAIDKEGTILITNAAAAGLTQLPQDAIVGKNIKDLFKWTRDLQPFTVQYDTDGSVIYPDLEYMDHTGTTHFVKIIVARAAGEQGQQVAQTIVTIHDETKTRELENMKIDFVSMAAHELRTPLASLRGYIELISYKEGPHISEEANKYLKQALKSSNELGGLINNLLDVTRIERGTLTLHMERMDLAATITQAVDDMRFAAEDKQVRLSYDGQAEGAFVMADTIALREVVNNLLTNAIKYTPAHGAISISLKRDGDDYATGIQDTGIGIPKKALPYLFTKFYRVHGGLNSGSTGTGLGLFISKSIVERHNGTIGVTSQEGVGSVFTFTVPAAGDSQSAQQDQDQETQTFIRRHRGWVTKNTTR